jgi:hypothetical protein
MVLIRLMTRTYRLALFWRVSSTVLMILSGRGDLASQTKAFRAQETVCPACLAQDITLRWPENRQEDRPSDSRGLPHRHGPRSRVTARLRLAATPWQAGEGIRTLDVQLGKLAFYH